MRGERRREATANGGGGMQWQENHWPWRSEIVAKLLSFFISGTELLSFFFLCVCVLLNLITFFEYHKKLFFYFWVSAINLKRISLEIYSVC